MSLRRTAWEDIRRPQGIRESGDRPGMEWRIPSRRANWEVQVYDGNRCTGE